MTSQLYGTGRVPWQREQWNCTHIGEHSMGPLWRGDGHDGHTDHFVPIATVSFSGVSLNGAVRSGESSPGGKRQCLHLLRGGPQGGQICSKGQNNLDKNIPNRVTDTLTPHRLPPRG